jgi:hypothetical protein
MYLGLSPTLIAYHYPFSALFSTKLPNSEHSQTYSRNNFYLSFDLFTLFAINFVERSFADKFAANYVS